ncbi:class I SAM-dependent methyltransferase [Motilimonas sp. KMU-193]|uniref:class I SAM-dependent methyltransferase n=1 Tax=Motilimonas sp. KMU-193 TaxID=3388668 RepID=UPI00396B22DC
MSSYFQAYGERAFSLDNHTQIAGRYGIQQDAEKNIVKDIVAKLDLNACDHLLEIGCGTGNLLIPLSFSVSSCVGIDHQDCLKKFSQRSTIDNIHLLPGDFLTLPNSELGSFNKVVIYSVLHCLPDDAAVIEFIDKAFELLAPGGMMLLGDIPNTDTKQRFLASQEGQLFSQQWAQQVERATIAEVPFEAGLPSCEFNDDKILALVQGIRTKGAQAYLMAQPCELPFGHTREDILIRKYS